MSKEITIIVASITGPTAVLDFVTGVQTGEPGRIEFVDTKSGFAFGLELYPQQYDAFVEAVEQIVWEQSDEAGHAKTVEVQDRKEEVVPNTKRGSVGESAGPAPIGAFLHLDSDGPGSSDGAEERVNWGNTI